MSKVLSRMPMPLCNTSIKILISPLSMLYLQIVILIHLRECVFYIIYRLKWPLYVSFNTFSLIFHAFFSTVTSHVYIDPLLSPDSVTLCSKESHEELGTLYMKYPLPKGAIFLTILGFPTFS